MERDFDVTSDIVRKRSREIGNNIMICFWIEILGIVIPFLTVLMTMVSLLSWSATLMYSVASLIKVVGLLVIISSIVYAVLLLTLKKYDDAFLYAGVLYAASQIISFLQNYVPAGIGFLLSAANVVVTFLSVKYFIDALANSVRLVSPGIASSLEAYFYWYTIFMVASFVCVFAAFIPIINIFDAVVSVLIGIGSLIISIWRLVLVWQAATSLQRAGR